MIEKDTFFNRDLSWLGFNERVLMEAGRDQVPLLERIKFLSIYSSNLDEFYRVRMPVLMALDTLTKEKENEEAYRAAKAEIDRQQRGFGKILSENILPELLEQNIHWIYNQEMPSKLREQTGKVFFNEILAVLHPVRIDIEEKVFFAQNNRLYQIVILKDEQEKERIELVNVPSDLLPRFYQFQADGQRYVVFLDDIIKQHLEHLFPKDKITGVFNVKITRDAELRLEEELDADMAAMIEKELAKRDLGLATRFLCEPGIPLRCLYRIIYALKLEKASVVEGGVYHNLKDLGHFPLEDKALEYPGRTALNAVDIPPGKTLFEQIAEQDILIHVPYESYDPILRFFNEAAHDPAVEEVYCTLYRVANPSRIIQALISASQNGKKVTAMLELKARFDEANNIKWAAQMKAAGVKIIYSSVSFKVHAKVALLKRREGEGKKYLGLLATGNLNESTARFYTDHILLTAYEPMLKELELLFGFLGKKKKRPAEEDFIDFKHLLVAQFNLQSRFLALIDQEIQNASKGLSSGITIKLNNLEERVLIAKLYEASRAGVKVQLLVRSICCLIPGVKGQSEQIQVRRIVDRYLEHGRVFVFHNQGDEKVFLGSADWMNRNIYSRIEVCFPVYEVNLKKDLINILDLQLADNVQAVELNDHLQNITLTGKPEIRSQEAIYAFIETKLIKTSPHEEIL
ncbi:polyphosphate kinase 1 [Pedobacter sp. HMWF019]|uniref:polyphosphate kinase 1 n=1 Tax=Pedobacter sp. HMWF019 TaxID=2056856 RepID=UPI001E2D2CB1|nr:polyphosphate kinase 1 [Pedobacter sp. HMWF019]